MLSKIIGFSVKNKLFIGLFIISWIAIGIYQTTRLPIDAVPDITNNQVQIITVSPAFSAEDIERLITFPLEQSVSTIPHRKEIRSISKFGLSILTVVFEDNIDIYWARQQINERINSADLDQRIGKPELAPITTGLGEVYQYTIQTKKGFENQFSLEDLRTLQDWQIRRQLLNVKGVADVSSFGGKLKQYEIAIDPIRLKEQKVSITDLFNALSENNENTGGAYLEREQSVLYIRSLGLMKSKDDIRNTIVGYSEQQLPILVKDVAEVKIGSAIRYGALTYDGKGETVGGIVMMLKGSNSYETTENIKSKIAEIQNNLPQGLEIKPFLDRTKMIGNAIYTVKKNLLEGALIVVFVLILFLGNLRAGLIVASVIPLSLLFAITMMNFFGVSGNLMSLGALDFGLIVDGAVIIVEAVLHLLHSNKYLNNTRITSEEMNLQVTTSSTNMMNVAVFGQIIILLVYLPILSLQGIEGKMFKPMAQTVAFALLGAFILSLTYIPMITSLALSKTISSKKNFSDIFMHKIETIFTKWTRVVYRFKTAFISGVVLLFLICCWTFYRMGGEFIPQLEEGDFAVETRLLVGTNLSTTIETFNAISSVLKTEFPEVEQVVTRVGTGEIPTDPMPIESGDMIIVLKPKKNWTSASSYEDLANKIQKTIQSKFLGVTLGFQFPVQMRFNELMTGSKQDVVIKVYGENLDKLTSYAEQISKLVPKVNGTTDLYMEKMIGMPQVIIDYNRAKMAQFGVSIQEVNKIINTAFAGGVAGMIYEEEKRFDLVVRLNDIHKNDPAILSNLLINTSKGIQVPLRELATIKIEMGPNQIQRENAHRRITVGFNVRGRDVESVVNDLQKSIRKNVQLEEGYTLDIGGTFENLQEAKSRLIIAIPVALLTIFALLFFTFRNVTDGLLIFTAIPLSSIGGILALSLRNMPFSISAGIGFIALFGVAVLNGIVLITEINKVKRQQSDWPITKVVLEATKTRLRPVLMTASVASLGFIPMALSNGAGAEVQRPLATVVIGGLISATFLTLFLLPVLYPIFHRIKKVSTMNILLPFIVFLGVNIAHAQTKITLEQATQIMLHNNRQVKFGAITLENMKYLKKGAFDIPKTDINMGFGNYNSNYNDVNFSVSQRFSFPTFYTNSSKVVNAEINRLIQEQKIAKQDWMYLLRKVYFEFQLIQQKKKLLSYSDSLLQLYVSRTKKRYEVGESSLSNQAIAQTQQHEMALQLENIQQDEQIIIQQFQFILQSDSVYYPILNTDKLPLPKGLVVTEDAVKNLPAYQQLLEQISVNKWQLKTQKAALLPEFMFSYTNQSLSGFYTINNQDVFYGRTKRFSSFNIGLSIPIFITPSLKRLRFSQLQIDAQQMQLDAKLLEYKMYLNNSLLAIEKASKQLDFFENIALKNSQTLLNESNQKAQLGEIDFFQWLVLTQQAIRIQNDYLDALRNYNEQIILFKKLNNE